DPLWKIMQASYQAVINTKTNLTEECWLCYDIRPPYYEAIGQIGKVQWLSTPNPHECKWGESEEQTPGLTMQHVTGVGTCIG
ncbi:ENV1 protein, partial [Ceuthmochares aereus]|nr:ENV1 protein [Ceuthmochares aereus]